MSISNALRLLVVISVIGIVSSDVYVSSGTITITGLDACVFENNGLLKNFTGPGTVDGLYFGLIKYNCTDTTGILVSKLSCKECGLYCNYNQLIDGCQSYWVPFISGSMTVIFVILILCSFPKTRVLFYKGIIYSTESIMYLWTRCQDKKEMRKVNKMMKRNVRDIEPSFMKPINKHQSFIRKLEDKRSKNIYVEIELPEVGKDVSPTAPEDNQPETKHVYNTMTAPKTPTVPRRYPSLTALMCGAALLGSMPPVIDCCDNTLYIKSDGKICDSTHCVELKMYDMPLQTGSITCFKDLNGEMLKIRIDKSYWRSRFTLMYRTSDVSLDVYKYRNCKGAGLCTDGMCERKSVNKYLVNEKNGTIHDYGCTSESLGCDTWCYHGVSCVWYKWVMDSIGPQYPVYQKNSELWEVVVSVEYKDVITKYTVNVNNPRVNLEGIFGNMPIFVTGFSSTIKHSRNGLIVIDDLAYAVTVSDINMPQTDIIGDYQISLDNKTHIYNKHMVTCETTSCSTKCEMPEPKIRRIKRNLDIESGVLFSYIGGKYIVETREDSNSLIKIMIGNVDFNNLQVDPAKCDINIAMTYSCIGCETLPYVVFQSTNIVSEGIIPILSNCSTTNNFISCSRDPYKLEITTDEKICLIEMPTLNKTIVANFEFAFKGKLDPTISLYAKENTEQLIKSVVTSNSFIQGVVGTFSSVTIMTVVASLAVRLIKVWQYNKFARDQMRA